jgi:hypothetical protein
MERVVDVVIEVEMRDVCIDGNEGSLDDADLGDTTRASAANTIRAAISNIMLNRLATESQLPFRRNRVFVGVIFVFIFSSSVPASQETSFTSLFSQWYR